MKYAEAVRYLSGLRRFGVRLGNERMDEILACVGDPHRAYGIAHVTGTKGKGSTTAMIAAILHAHGFRAGGYFSPYVYDLCERVQVDGTPIARRSLARHVERLAPVIESVGSTPLGPATEFELKTALAFTHFALLKVDFAAVEVGIGGRLDATNVVLPLVSVITNVGLDHTEILGETLAKIAEEKAGIIKPHAPVVTAAEAPDAIRVVRAKATAAGVPVLCVSQAARSADLDAPQTRGRIRWKGDSRRFRVATPTATYDDLALAMRGDHQCANAACAIGAVEAISASRGFRMSAAAVRDGLASVALPGRFAVIRQRPMVVADGAHNGLSARALAAEMRNVAKRRLILVVGMLRGHDPDDFLRELAPEAAIVFATRPLWRRALDAEDIAAVAKRYSADVRMAPTPLRAAHEAITEADPDDVVLITGSFYTVGDVPPERISSPKPRRS